MPLHAGEQKVRSLYFGRYNDAWVSGPVSLRSRYLQPLLALAWRWRGSDRMTTSGLFIGVQILAGGLTEARMASVCILLFRDFSTVHLTRLS
jgi:hypothetical protein